MGIPRLPLPRQSAASQLHCACLSCLLRECFSYDSQIVLAGPAPCRPVKPLSSCLTLLAYRIKDGFVFQNLSTISLLLTQFSIDLERSISLQGESKQDISVMGSFMLLQDKSFNKNCLHLLPSCHQSKGLPCIVQKSILPLGAGVFLCQSPLYLHCRLHLSVSRQRTA